MDNTKGRRRWETEKKTTNNEQKNEQNTHVYRT